MDPSQDPPRATPDAPDAPVAPVAPGAPQAPETPDAPDAPDHETMAQIRARRLARLGCSAPSTRKSDNSEGPSTSTAAKESTIVPTTVPATASASSSSSSSSPSTSLPRAQTMTSSKPNPFSKLVARTAAESGATGPPAQQQRKMTSTFQTPPSSDEPIDDEWTSNTLAHIFRATVDPSRKTDSHGHALRLLPDLAEDLGSAGEPLKLTVAHIDQILMESGRNYRTDRPLLEYLFPCWKRAVRLGQLVKSPHKRAVVEEARRLSLAICLFSFTMPELFNRPLDEHGLAALLLGEIDCADEGNDRLIWEFVADVVRTKLDEDDANATVFADALYTIGQRLLSLGPTDDTKPYIKALTICSKFNPLLNAVASHNKFLVRNLKPQDIERDTILGPFFRLSPLQMNNVLRDFPNARTMDQHTLRVAQDSVKMQSRAFQQELFTITNAFIRSSPETRFRVLDWFAYVLNTNHKRRALRVDPREVASDGLMLNITCVLDLLCEPFLDNTFSKVDRIEPDYLRRKPRIDISDETKINTDLAESKAFWGTPASGDSNFISEVFFLTLAAHHYGTEAVNSLYKNLERDIKWMEKQIKSMEAEKVKISNALQLRHAETMITKHTSALERTVAFRHSIQALLLDTSMQGLSLRFMRYVVVWLLRVATGTSYTPDKTVQLPLPAAAPLEFECLPEYVLQNVVDNFKFIFRHMPQILVQATGDELITLCITFLHTSNYIKNPYLKSSLVTILYWGTLDYTNRRKGVLTDQLIGMKFANDHLLHSLMKFYIECESTGAHTQFFDKFNIRFEIFQVIKVIWVNDVYKDQLTRESEHNRSFFVRFVNLLLNDATFVLDEALGKFPRIHDIEAKLEEDDREKSLSQEDRSKQEEELQNLQTQATSYMQLANESLQMMKLFTEALVSAFTMPEIVSRLASMMNYNLETLAGLKAGQLKVSQMQEKYKFRPVTSVSDFVAIYLNLGSSQLFIDAVAADGRSFKPETLERAGTILEKRNMADPKDLRRWAVLQAKFKHAKAVLDQAEIELGEVPAEYEDPIMGDIMRDPVMLPSRHIIDRSTIAQHLLSDPTDPFTRQPMTEHDVVPATELKERIEQWREEKIAAARAKAAPVASGDGMDISED